MPAAYCSDVYAEEIQREQDAGKPGFFSKEYSRTNNREWICPNVDQIEVLNDPLTEDRQYLRVDIYQCTYAKYLYSNFNSTTYAEPGEKACEPFTVSIE